VFVRRRRIRLVVYPYAVDRTAPGELVERRHGDRRGIDLEEVAQRGTRVAAAEAVGAERVQAGGTKRATWSATAFM
jgi:hypothetical protein